MVKVEPLMVVGADAIAEVLGLGRNKVRRLLGEGKLPARKVGRLWVSSRCQLNRWVDGVLAGDKGTGLGPFQ